MAAPINVELRGYLDFFGLKNGGQNPQQPAGFLQPTMDLERWYMESREKPYDIAGIPLINATTGAGVIPIPNTSPTNIGNGTRLIVPQNEVWILLPGTYIAADFGAVAGQSIELGLVFGNFVGIVQPLQNVVPLQRRGFWASNAAVTQRGEAVLERLHWGLPGSMLYIRNYGAAVPGGSIAVSGSLRLVRLLV